MSDKQNTYRSTEPNQHNPRQKIKYTVDYRVPIAHNPCLYTKTSNMYGADGMLRKGSVDATSEFTKTNRTISTFDDDFDDDFDQKFFGETVSRDTTNKQCCVGKSRYIHAPYTPSGTLSNGGFGPDMKRFAELKVGISTRDNFESVSDERIDDLQFHFLHRNYNDKRWGSFPMPENTRLSNKKTLNTKY